MEQFFWEIFLRCFNRPAAVISKTEELDIIHFILCYRWQRWSNGSTKKPGQAVRPRWHHLMGHWLRRAQPTRSLHTNLRIQRLDQPDFTILEPSKMFWNILETVFCEVFTRDFSYKIFFLRLPAFRLYWRIPVYVF